MSQHNAEPESDSRKKIGGVAKHVSSRVLEQTLTTAFARYAAILVFVAVLFATESIVRFRMAEEVSESNAEALNFASELRARLDRELNSVLYLGSGIVGYLVVRHTDINSSEIEHILAAVHGYGQHVRNMSIAVGYRPTYVYPLAGNEQILGQDYQSIPAQWPSVQTAIKTRSVVLTGPVNLVQGGTGLIYRTPIFIKDNYWGMLSTVVDIPSLLRAALTGIEKDRFEFAIRTEENGKMTPGLLLGASQLFSATDSLLLEAPMPNGKWVYAVRPADRRTSILTLAIRGMGWALALMAGFCIITLLHHRRELSHLADFDSLTNLPNRRLFDDRMEQAFRRHARKGEGPIALLFIDINDFKPINDRFGHLYGDRVLQATADRLREEVRIGDTVSRWAGDEFALIIEDANRDLVDALIERLQRRIAKPLEVYGHQFTLSTAIGSAFYPEEADSPASLLKLADQRMYEAKKNSKGKVTGA